MALISMCPRSSMWINCLKLALPYLPPVIRNSSVLKKLQDEAEKPKELNSSLVSKLKDSVERDSKSLVNLFTAYYLEGFKDCKAKGQILCPHAEWDKVQPDQLED
ncbi:hypothetical protein FF1_008096 [Malus domestica]